MFIIDKYQVVNIIQELIEIEEQIILVAVVVAVVVVVVVVVVVIVVVNDHSYWIAAKEL